MLSIEISIDLVQEVGDDSILGSNLIRFDQIQLCLLSRSCCSSKNVLQSDDLIQGINHSSLSIWPVLSPFCESNLPLIFSFLRNPDPGISCAISIDGWLVLSSTNDRVGRALILWQSLCSSLSSWVEVRHCSLVLIDLVHFPLQVQEHSYYILYLSLLFF